MKNIFKYLGSTATVAACALTLAGCVEETLPQSDMATDEIVASSSAATEGIANGMSAYGTDLWSTSNHFCFGYPAQMIIRDVLTGDYMHLGETGYSKWRTWQYNMYMGQDYLYQQFVWNYHYEFLGTVNGVIRSIKEEGAAPGPLSYLASALAYRAMIYLDLARMYEFLPNDIYKDGKNNEGNTVLNLTVPIVKEDLTEEGAKFNPRATREEMYEFILADLNKAEKYIPNLSNTINNTLPNLACVYGLKARLYMWVEDYENAKIYARKAIDAAEDSKVYPIKEAQALGVSTGYNTASDFMWCFAQNSETYAVQTGIMNWISWVSNQSTYGYTGEGTMLHVAIDKSMYDRISDTDWRKKQWVAPAGSALEGKNTFIDEVDKKTIPAYGSLKFRPNAGDREDYLTGAATAIPVMRVEEMYFIEAEAAEHVTPGAGIELLKKFMTENRDASYVYSGTDAIDEIVFQKRVELWGEGQTFFDIKRLNMSVTRGYEGTNWQDTQSLLNTNGRPAWTNYVIVKTEAASNSALVNFNNPDPSDSYPTWSPK